MDLKGIYTADANRYTDAEALYKRCGKSGVLLPKISLGFWHNFGVVDPPRLDMICGKVLMATGVPVSI